MKTPEQVRLERQVNQDRARRELQEAEALRAAFPHDPSYLQRVLDARTKYYNS